MLVQYVNGCPEPNEITIEIEGNFQLAEMKCIISAVYHVSVEANEAVRDYVLTDELLCFRFKG